MKSAQNGSRAAAILDQVAALSSSEPSIPTILGLGAGPHTISTLFASILAGAVAESAARECIREEANAVFSKNAHALDAALCDIFTTAAKDYAPGQEVTTLLFSRGIHALLAHRVSHALWMSGRRDMALAIKTVLARALSTDVHPAATIGRGVWLDHGVGFVVGETAIIEDEVCIWHDVTLGSTLKASGPGRHPRVRKGAVIGAGAILLGGIEIGEAAVIAAGAVVLNDVAAASTVAGVPARIKPRNAQSFEGF